MLIQQVVHSDLILQRHIMTEQYLKTKIKILEAGHREFALRNRHLCKKNMEIAKKCDTLEAENARLKSLLEAQEDERKNLFPRIKTRNHLVNMRVLR